MRQTNNQRCVRCPRCSNEEYSPDALYCRICVFQFITSAREDTMRMNTEIKECIIFTEMWATPDIVDAVVNRQCC